MIQKPKLYDPDQLGPDSDLQTVLAAWHGATVRLEHTHESLRAEVQRLTAELEVKNRDLARKNRLADLGQMASHVAHEVRNSLVPVTLYLSLLRRRLTQDPASLDLLDKVECGLTDVDACVHDLLHFAADRDPHWESVQLHSLIADVIESLRPQWMAQGVHVDIDVPPAHRAVLDRNMLRRAVLNVALNAIDAMPNGGDLVITSYNGPGGLELEIADSGPGLSEETRQRAFEPFYSTKSHGTGLGLAIVSRITEAHGGSCQAQNCPDGGAAFTLRFPLRIREAAA
ncbi:MAG: ATP-binding protein [Planctomycetota bacterium]|nr:ATP-binding protein [Planctomycetota bacterium]